MINDPLAGAARAWSSWVRAFACHGDTLASKRVSWHKRRVMTPPIVRPALDADGPALAGLISDVFAEYEGCLYLPEEFPEMTAPASHFGRRGGRLWVAEEGGAARLVGSVAYANTARPGVFELFKLYVAADRRGAGLAGRLLDLALAEIVAAGGTRLVLWSDTRFRAGHAFYVRRGFRRLPGIRALHDQSATLEFGFGLDLLAGLPGSASPALP
jgi:putative acetyltransferase